MAIKHKPCMCLKEVLFQKGNFLACWVMWSSIEVHLVDALAAEGDEGRRSLR